ncbi:hypothetical protein AHAS_Ahas01G0091700 [Arachis hypogaea]
MLKMARTSKKNRKKINVADAYECSSNIIPRDIWVKIATKVASNSIKDLFNMQIDHCIGGMDTLTMAAMGSDVEACYLFAMLLLSLGKEDEGHMRRGPEFFETIRASRAVKRCREVFRQVFEPWWMKVKSSDPGQPKVCQSTSCSTRGTMGVMEDLSGVSCVQCLVDYEVRGFLESFVLE